MAALKLLTQQVVGTSFAFYTEDEVRALSVKQVTNPQTFDSFNRPTEGGLYDRALGPTDFGVTCPTCGLGACHSSGSSSFGRHRRAPGTFVGTCQRAAALLRLPAPRAHTNDDTTT